MFHTSFLKNHFNLKDGFRSLKLSTIEVFPHFGYIAFCGPQGSGKSLSAHKLIFELLQAYPGVELISNVSVSYAPFIPYEGVHTVANIQHKGIILFLDEITNIFTSLDSKNMNQDWFRLLNMQRKRELLIVSTCPVFSRIPKPFREQFDTVCLCDSWFGCLQVNSYYRANVDKMFMSESSEEAIASLDLLRKNFFFRSPEDFARYDTSEIVNNFDLAELEDR